MLGKTEHLTNDVDNENWLHKTVSGTPEVHLPSLALVASRFTLYPGEVDEWMKMACKALVIDAKAVRRTVLVRVEEEEEAAAERAEIENGVSWSIPLKDRVDEFTWL